MCYVCVSFFVWTYDNDKLWLVHDVYKNNKEWTKTVQKHLVAKQYFKRNMVTKKQRSYTVDTSEFENKQIKLDVSKNRRFSPQNGWFIMEKPY